MLENKKHSGNVQYIVEGNRSGSEILCALKSRLLGGHHHHHHQYLYGMLLLLGLLACIIPFKSQKSQNGL